MAKSKKLAVPSKAATTVPHVPLQTLRGLLGKPVDDPAVKALVENTGAKVSSDFIVAKQAGFDCALARGAKKKVLSTVFLFPEGGDGHRGFRDLPKGFAFSTRKELLGKLPKPAMTWKIGPGKVPVETEGASWDKWEVDGVDVRASYSKDGSVRHITLSSSKDTTGGASLSTSPLHFETKPADAPKDAELVGMALLVAWAVDRFGLSAKHANTELGKQFAKRAITPREFLIKACGKTLTTLDVAPKVGEFLEVYTHNQHRSDEGSRKPVGETIKKLLKLSRSDERRYTDDFLGTFKGAVENPFHVPDAWEAVDRIAPVIDARFADFEATGFTKLPDLAPYEKAAKLRDKVSVKATRAQLAQVTVDDALAEELVGLIDRPLTDKHVKDVITRAGMPVGKKIDQQANPALGVAYMGTKLEIDGKKQLGVSAVYFYASKYKSYIRGIGAEIEFVGYPGVLPKGLRIGDSRKTVREKLGTLKSEHEDYDHYEPTATRRIACQFKKDKLVMVRFGKPIDY